MKTFLSITATTCCAIACLSAAPPSPTISFQGRLLDPATGIIKADGSYQTTFRLYQNSSGGSASWTETKMIAVENGFFTTLLGDTTPLDASDFDLYHAWLGIEMTGDSEMVPRHRISYSPYAINALRFQGLEPGQFLLRDAWATSTVNSSAYDALTITQLSDRSAMVGVSGANGSGEAAIKGIATPASSTIINSAAGVLGSSHDQRGVIGISNNSDGVFGWSTDSAGTVGQSVNGAGVSAYSQNGNAIEATGTGVIAASKLIYHTPRTHYVSVPGDIFRPRVVDSTVAWQSTLGTGGAFLTSGTGFANTMIAPANLPHGAVIQSVTAVISDTSTTADLKVALKAVSDISYSEVAEVTSSGSAGTDHYVDSTIPAKTKTVNNIDYSYVVWAIPAASASWSAEQNKLTIKQVVIAYTLSEAP